MSKATNIRIFTDNEVRQAIEVGKKAGDSIISAFAVFAEEKEKKNLEKVMRSPMSATITAILQHLKMEDEHGE